MTDLASLWLPILFSAVGVFLVSSVIHMATPWHKGDFVQLPDETRFRDAVRPLGIPPGDYMVPRCKDSKDMRSPEFADKLNEGPVMILTVLPSGQRAMGQSLAQWFVYCAVVGVFAAYVAGRAIPPGAHYLSVFRFAGVAAFLGYAVALWQTSIWYKRSWATTARMTLDGLLYALVTAGCFGWLWPRS
jgi:hypothetical protein